MWCCNGDLSDRVAYRNKYKVQQPSGKEKEKLLLVLQQQLMQTQQKLELIQQQVRKDCTCILAICIDGS